MKHFGFCIVPRLVMRSPRFAKLPMSAKWLYGCLRDICGEGEGGECFYALRNLKELIHMSASTLSRSINQLAEIGLITAQKVGAKGREIFRIKIVNIWKENDVAYKDCFKMGQLDEAVSNEVPTVSESSPTVSNSDGTVSEQSINPAQDCFNFTDKEESSKKTTLEEDTTEEDLNSSPSTSLSVSLSGEESSVDQLRQWIKEYNAGQPIHLRIYASKDKAKEAADLALLVPHIRSLNDLKDCYTFAKEHIYGVNKTVFLGNMAGSAEDWVKSLNEDSKPQEISTPKTMNHGEADAFAQWLMQQPGFCWEIVAIDRAYPNNDTIWVTCIQIATDDWLPFGSPDHFFDASPWEQARIDQAIQYGQSLRKTA